MRYLSWILIFVCCGSFRFLAQTAGEKQNMGKKELFIYHLKLTDQYNDTSIWTEETTLRVNQHAEFLDNLGQEGILVFAGRTKYDPGDDRLFGVAIFKANSLEHAREIMEHDPGVIYKIHTGTILPFSMGIRYLENLVN